MEHGHAHLLNWLQDQDPEVLKGKTLVEIGTVREVLANQNSTEKFARFCVDHEMDFITVDMNQETIDKADKMLATINPKFRAVCMKGEDFFANEDVKKELGSIDYVYLDAFDFNHQHHSQKRRDDYKKYLGCDIQDDLCHQAHLEMSQNLIEHWSPLMICWDDCWYTNGEIQGKGKLGVPYLLENGWRLEENWVMTPSIIFL